MSDALELVLRYFVAAGCEWLVQHGLQGFDDGNIVSAVTTIATGAILFACMVGRGLFKSSVSYVIARLKARHKTDLVEAASEVDGVHVIHATPAIADAIPGPKVVAP